MALIKIQGKTNFQGNVLVNSEAPMVPFWTFTPNNNLISNFTASTVGNLGITVDWGNNEKTSYNQNFLISKQISSANTSVAIRSNTAGDPIFAINLGSSVPKVKGAIDLSQFQGLTYFNCEQDDIDSVIGYDQIPGLLYLFINNNKITGQIPSLNNLTELETFRAEQNLLTGGLPSLTNNTKLKIFYASQNSLSGSIPSLSTNLLLNNFRINNNQLTGTIPSLSSNTALVTFWCQANQLTGNIPNLSANTEMVSFNCSNNKLTGWDGGNIPPKLTSFTAGTNNLTVQTVDALLSAFETMSNTTGLSGTLHVGLAGNAVPSTSGYRKTSSSGTNFTRVGNLVTANVTNHGFTNGQMVTFTGLNPSQLQGTFVVNVVNANQFTFNTLTSGNVTGSGTATMRMVTGPCGYRTYQNLAVASRSTGPWAVTINQPA